MVLAADLNLSMVGGGAMTMMVNMVVVAADTNDTCVCVCVVCVCVCIYLFIIINSDDITGGVLASSCWLGRDVQPAADSVLSSLWILWWP